MRICPIHRRTVPIYSQPVKNPSSKTEDECESEWILDAQSHAGMDQNTVFNRGVDILSLLVFTVLFVLTSGRVLRRSLMKGLGPPHSLPVVIAGCFDCW